MESTKNVTGLYELLSSPHMAERYLDVAGVMILALDNMGRVALVNRRGEEILGRSRDELIGADWFSTCLPKDLRKRVKKLFRDIIAGGSMNSQPVEGLIVTGDGCERIVIWRV